MDNPEVVWLIPTLLQVLGLAITLGALGFTYEGSRRERKSMVTVLEQGHQARWLVAGVVIFAVGLCFTRMAWGYKVIAVILGILISGLAITSSEKEKEVRRKAIKLSASQRKKLFPFGWILLGVILVLVIAWAAHLGWHTKNLVVTALSLQDNPSQVKIENIIPTVDSAAGDLAAIHQDLRPFFPVLRVLIGMPLVGSYLGQVEPLVTYADSLAQAGKEVVQGLVPLLDEMQADQADSPLLEHASQVLQTGREHFDIAAGEIESADAVRNQIRLDLMPVAIRPFYLQLDENFDLLSAGIQLLQAAPTLLGNGQVKNYLILAQNRDELRATGGFISGIGLVTLQDGKIQQFSLDDSYAIDDLTKNYPSPPEALKRFMLADYWVPRDANWSPDFPTAARQAQELYSLSTGVEIQGVIAFNQLAVQSILEATGPVEVPGTNEPVSAQNVENYMRQAWAPTPEQGLSQEWWAHRKDFMQQLGTVIIEQAFNLSDSQQLTSLAKVMLDLLNQGQLLVYFNDASAQAALEESSLTGAVHPGNGDYLYLVDSNVGFNKMDSVIQRSVTYQVDLSDVQQPTGMVTLVYQNAGKGDAPCQQVASYGNGTYQDMQQRCYWDYWRVYTPQGTRLLSSTAQPVQASELLNGQGWPGQVESLAGEADTQVFAGMLVLPLSSSAQFDLAYGLPGSILQPAGTGQIAYSLLVDVQPGLRGLPFKLEISLPVSAHMASSSDGFMPSGIDAWIWQGVLDRSIQLNLTFTQ
jgi:hypothetical protein